MQGGCHHRQPQAEGKDTCKPKPINPCQGRHPCSQQDQPLNHQHPAATQPPSPAKPDPPEQITTGVARTAQQQNSCHPSCPPTLRHPRWKKNFTARIDPHHHHAEQQRRPCLMSPQPKAPQTRKQRMPADRSLLLQRRRRRLEQNVPPRSHQHQKNRQQKTESIQDQNAFKAANTHQPGSQEGSHGHHQTIRGGKQAIRPNQRRAIGDQHRDQAGKTKHQRGFRHGCNALNQHHQQQRRWLVLAHGSNEQHPAKGQGAERTGGMGQQHHPGRWPVVQTVCQQRQHQNPGQLHHQRHQAEVEQTPRLRKQPQPNAVQAGLGAEVGDQLSTPQASEQKARSFKRPGRAEWSHPHGLGECQ